MKEIEETLTAKYLNNIIKNLERLETIGAISNNEKHEIYKNIISKINES